MSTSIGQVLKGRYEIREQLGQGEHGRTWKAWDTRTRPPGFCVIKEPIGSHRAIKELESESAAAGLLHHKNIVPVVEFNELEGFLVAEYVQGVSLQTRLRNDIRNGTWPDIEESNAIIIQCLEGLEYAHEKGRIHGDVKPGNIMLQDAGEARLTDFGVSRFVVGSIVSAGAPWDPSRLGSATFAAPEVLIDREWSFQSDLFSIGVLAYLLLTKRHPFVDESGLWSTNERIIDPIVIPRELSYLNPAVEKNIDTIICRLLERATAKRYRQAREVLDCLLGKGPKENLCPHCNGDNPQKVRFCNHCGQSMVGYRAPDSEIERQLNISYSLFRAGQTDDAIGLAQSIVKSCPEFGKAWGQLTFMLTSERRYEDALGAAEQCIAFSPGFAIGYRNKGIALSALGRFGEAISQFDLALEHEDRPRDQSQILYNKAYTLRLSGKLQEAITTLEKALSADPLNVKVSRLLLRLQQGRKDSVQAE